LLLEASVFFSFTILFLIINIIPVPSVWPFEQFKKSGVISIGFWLVHAGFGLVFDGSHQLLGETVEAFGDKNEFAQPQQGAAECFTAGQPNRVFFFFENKAVNGMNAETMPFPDDLFSRLTFGNGGHDLNRQVIGPHLKGKTGVFCHTVARDDAAIFAHRIPALPVFHGRKDAPDHDLLISSATTAVTVNARDGLFGNFEFFVGGNNKDLDGAAPLLNLKCLF
jgi:hypothetical protein